MTLLGSGDVNPEFNLHENFYRYKEYSLERGPKIHRRVKFEERCLSKIPNGLLV